MSSQNVKFIGEYDRNRSRLHCSLTAIFECRFVYELLQCPLFIDENFWYLGTLALFCVRCAAGTYTYIYRLELLDGNDGRQNDKNKASGVCERRRPS